MQDPMPPNIKYEATIRFLSTGFLFRIHQSTIVNLYQIFVRQFTRD